MPRRLSKIALSLFVVAAMPGMGLFALPGCGSPAPPSAEAEAHIIAYTVRGRISQLPVVGRPASELMIHHEPIPSFLNGGKVVGMSSMTMPFPPSEGLSLEGLRLGQAVEMTFEVTYDPENETPRNIQATKLTPLPDETILVFEVIDASPASP